MGADSAIQWTHHTFNPWRGCTHVSPGCEHCYAEALSKRNPAQLGTWGAGGTRVIASESYWRQPERWNRAAEKAGERHRVFCASLADAFEDRPELWAPRARLGRIIEATPHLDWLLLTKRPENVRRLLLAAAATRDWVKGAWPPNVWLGTTVEDQRRVIERIPVLLDTPAVVRFLSCEPLLGSVDLEPWLWTAHEVVERDASHRPTVQERHWSGAIDWMIVGGESGPKARPMDLAWARSLVEQCRAAGVPVFCKQMGAVWAREHGASDRHGGVIEEFPEDLRVRDFPEVARAHS